MSPLMILRVSGDQFVQPGDLTSLGDGKSILKILSDMVKTQF